VLEILILNLNVSEKSKKLVNFLVFFVVLIVGFGILTKSVLFGTRDNGDNETIPREILKISFFPLFGNLDYFTKYLDPNYCSSNSTSNSTQNCPNPIGVIYANIILIFYLFIMNILMINLLIASIKYFIIIFRFEFFLTIISLNFFQLVTLMMT